MKVSLIRLTVMSGERFVSALLASHDFTGVLGSQAPVRPRIEEGIEISRRPFMRDKPFGRSHEVEFYGDDAPFLIRYTGFIRTALANGDAVIVVMTASHRNSLRRKLESEGCDVSDAMERGSYVALEPSDVLSTFLTNGEPDAERFVKAASDFLSTALNAATGKHPRVAVCGECAALLHAEGKAEAAFEMERLWNELASTYNVDSLCGYPIERFRGKEQGPVFQRICAEHSAVYSQ
ncbi:MAG TPA: MEDS domain-containing protein [Terriglobales bacterium]|jgi:hypothetical protein|nr:MEDS domain-containing protein [Terriglobales bacterium]